MDISGGRRFSLRTAAKLLLSCVFFYFALLKDYLSWPFNTPYLAKAAIEIFHQFPRYHPSVWWGWWETALKISLSFLLWNLLFGLVFYPKGMRWQQGRYKKYLDYTQLLGLMTLLHAVRIADQGIHGLEHETEPSFGIMFYGVPLLLGGIAILYRTFQATHQTNVTVRQELTSLLPFFIAFLIVVLSLLTPIRDIRRVHFTLPYPFWSIAVSLYYIVFYPLCFVEFALTKKLSKKSRRRICG